MCQRWGMDSTTQRLWNAHDKHPGDRESMFDAVRAWSGARRVLYPGSYIDVAASFVFEDVVYVDMDRKAKRFFADIHGVDELIGGRATDHTWAFIRGDYREALPFDDGSFDLIISMYAGFVSEACGRHVRTGGHLLANTSHGDVALANLDPRFELVAVVRTSTSGYSVSEDIDGHCEPADGRDRSAEEIRDLGRGVKYTKSAAAYLFRRVG